MQNEDEKREAIEILAAKYSPSQVEGRKMEIDKEFKRLCIIELTIEHITGKESIELVRSRESQRQE